MTALEGERSPADALGSGAWSLMEAVLAVVLVALAGARVTLGATDIWLSSLLAAAMTPLWLRMVLRIRLAAVTIVIVLCCAFSGVVLVLAESDRVVKGTGAASGIIVFLGVFVTAGALVWAYRVLGTPLSMVVFGAANLVVLGAPTQLFTPEGWKFDYSVPVTVLLLGVAACLKRTWVTFAALALLMALCIPASARSYLAVLSLTFLVLLIWSRPSGARTRPSVRAAQLLLLGLGLYFALQSLLLDGFLGESTQARSLAQIQRGGSLLTGGRPELAATLGLMASRVWGYGPGVYPNGNDVNVARASMLRIGYDPFNGYVENYMFGAGFRLHSLFGDLWVSWGVVGVVLAVWLVVLCLIAVSAGPDKRGCDAVLLVVVFLTLWNVGFSPWYSSMPALTLAVSLIWSRFRDPGPRDAGEGAAR